MPLHFAPASPHNTAFRRQAAALRHHPSSLVPEEKMSLVLRSRGFWMSWAIFALLLAAALAAMAWGLNWLIQHDAVHWLVAANRWLAENFIERLGYFGVFALMFIESSFIPFPSEIIVPPAGHLARNTPGWSLEGVILMGVLGSLGGGLFNYALARYLGRPLLIAWIARYGRYLRISLEHYLAAEGFFQRHGAISTFTARLIPVIRQIISLPAGLARMNLIAFCVYTSLGAGIWVALLALLGYWFGSEPELLAATLKDYSRWLLAGGVLVVGGYVLFRRLRPAQPRE